ncbi:methyltransferase family protein [Kiloniella majae]|uniref:methyltransferase family protein n=1 Tax=Kiloniella majae TaxID=1938558 RepID=UPI000A278F56|nr:isoprenylcysteine carboxylmethyltransferase family protein [Kiloniella majae]
MKKLLPPVLFLLFVILMAVSCWLQGSPHHVPENYHLLTLPVVIAGLILAFSSSRLFRKKGTNIMTFGEPDLLVTEGVFKWSRNPMYLGFVTSLFALAFLMGGAYSSLALAVVFLLITDRWYIAFEEKAMRQKFGAEYDAYCQKVRRWI